ncbi:MAG: HAD-IC family P-type ATPase [Gaiellaceae bacterium]
MDGRGVAVGSEAWLTDRGYSVDAVAIGGLDAANGAGRAKVLVGVEGRLSAAIVMADHLRPDAHELVAGLRDAGIRHIALATGDRQAVAEEIGRAIGVDHVYAEPSPEAKLDLVRSIRSDAELGPVVMVGDGVNDARRSRSPMSESPSPRPAPPSQPRPQTPSSWSIGSGEWPMLFRSGKDRCGSRVRASWPKSA